MNTDLPNDTNAEALENEQYDQYASIGIAPSGVVIYDQESPAAWIASDATWENEP